MANNERLMKGRAVSIRLTSNRYHSFNDILNDLSSRLNRDGYHFPHGVRQIYTPVHGHRVTDLAQLEEGRLYLCAGNEPFKPLGAREQHRAARAPLPTDTRQTDAADRDDALFPMLNPAASNEPGGGSKIKHPSRARVNSRSLHLPVISNSGQTGGAAASTFPQPESPPHSPSGAHSPYFYYYQQYYGGGSERAAAESPASPSQMYKFPAMRGPIGDTRFHRMYRRFKLPPLQIGGLGLYKSPDGKMLNVVGREQPQPAAMFSSYPLYQFKARQPDGSLAVARGLPPIAPQPALESGAGGSADDHSGDESGSGGQLHDRRLLTIIYYEKRTDTSGKSPVKIVKILLSNKPDRRNHYSLKQVHKILNKSFWREKEKLAARTQRLPPAAAQPGKFHLVTPTGREVTSTPDLERIISGAESGEPELEAVDLTSEQPDPSSRNSKNFLFIAVTGGDADDVPADVLSDPRVVRVPFEKLTPRLSRADLEQILSELVSKNANGRLISKLQQVLSQQSISEQSAGGTASDSRGAQRPPRADIEVMDSGFEESDGANADDGSPRHARAALPPLKAAVAAAQKAKGNKQSKRASLPGSEQEASDRESDSENGSRLNEDITSGVGSKNDSEADKKLQMLEARRKKRLIAMTRRPLPPPTVPLTTIQESPLPAPTAAPARLPPLAEAEGSRADAKAAIGAKATGEPPSAESGDAAAAAKRSKKPRKRQSASGSSSESGDFSSESHSRPSHSGASSTQTAPEIEAGVNVQIIAQPAPLNVPYTQPPNETQQDTARAKDNEHPKVTESKPEPAAAAAAETDSEAAARKAETESRSDSRRAVRAPSGATARTQEEQPAPRKADLKVTTAGAAVVGGPEDHQVPPTKPPSPPPVRLPAQAPAVPEPPRHETRQDPAPPPPPTPPAATQPAPPAAYTAAEKAAGEQQSEQQRRDVPPPGAKRYTHTKYVTGLDRLTEKYEFGKQLGDGNFAIVRQCRCVRASCSTLRGRRGQMCAVSGHHKP